MTYIKKLLIKGFKSFARETEILMDRHINVIVGPNGSGKSNVTDALCFVLGRLSIKSMRAAKASHLIFSGNKQYKGANEAFVEIVFDNSDKTFAVEKDEITIRRIVRKNGQSIYRINNETKTRQEVLELLGQVGIDPHGFNIVLQGEIERFAKMPAEDRRKVIEEVAGISIYEMRKEKSIKELEKTEDKLKQINAVLRERTNYLRNLENEREQALKFKKLEETLKKCKASIINRNIQEKERELKDIDERIEGKKKEIEKKSGIILKTQDEIARLNEKIDSISKSIQKSSGFEQDTLLAEISKLKQEIAALVAKKENFENQLLELERRYNSLLEQAKTTEEEVNEMSKEKGYDKKKELEEKKKKLEELDELKRQFYILKSNTSSLASQIEDKKSSINRMNNESNFIISQIEELEKEIKIKSTLEQHSKALFELKESLKQDRLEINKLEESLLEKEKTSAIKKQEAHKAELIKLQVSKLDICPLCKTKITPEHIKEVIGKADSDIKEFNSIIEEAQQDIVKIKEKILSLKENVSNNISQASTREIDMIKIQSIEDKKSQLKRNSEQISLLGKDLSNLIEKKKINDDKLSKIKMSEENYQNLTLEINELSRHQEKNLGMEIVSKQRDIEKMKIAMKQNQHDTEDIRLELTNIKEVLSEKQELVAKKEEQAEILKRKYQKMFEEKNGLQDKVRNYESHVMHQQNEKRIFENDINNFMISRAEINAKKETHQQEFIEYSGIELISLPVDKLSEKLHQTEAILSTIGTVNLRALEVYDQIKKEYEGIKEKVSQLEAEKLEILGVIEQIDKKKKKTFLITLEKVNELFSRNFSQLSVKGIVNLEPQDKKDIFNAGIDITVAVGGGKYFDVTSLSGGEQTLVALSLIFAIQEYKPYCFYVFDEIDAALDRRNSEKLAYLLKKYMKEGQYIIITHNDSIISESSNVLYGVSMQEGISKVLSLEV